jgi:hypothetical protein
MKKLLITVLCVCALMAALVPPVSADGPTTVSGSFVNSGWIDPPQPTPSGNTCVLTGSGWHQWDGSFRGKEVFDVRIVVYGPCEEEEPNKFREELSWEGTFTGKLCLGGAWDGETCAGGQLREGSFDFTGAWEVTPAPSPQQTFSGSYVIGQGYDGLAGLGGEIDCRGRVGMADGWVEYVGQLSDAGHFQGIETTPYGTYGGVDYVRHVGTFAGTAAGGPYSAPFELIVPADPSQGNRRVLLEPLNQVEGSAVGSRLTPELLFGGGFSYAGICFTPPWPGAFPGHLCTDFQGRGGFTREGIWIEGKGDAAEIVAAFARALRDDPVAHGLIGIPLKLYSSGASAPAMILDDILHSPSGANLFDMSLLEGVFWPGGIHTLPEPDAGLVMMLASEAEVIAVNASALRGTAATYRSYEVAGAPHAAGVPDFPALDWAPVLRALFVAGDRWATGVADPPPSAVLANDANATDGIARDENGNALGGIRLPDLEVGRRRYIALAVSAPPASAGLSEDTYPLGLPMFGGLEDLACTPKADGSARFPDHETYVRRFSEAAQQLVADGYLLQDDADRMIVEAQASSVGTPEECLAPTVAEVLPETGHPAHATPHAEMAILAGLILLAMGTALHRRIKDPRA